MNQLARVRTPGVCEYEWTLLGYDERWLVHRNDLTYPISPVFRYAFEDHCHWDTEASENKLVDMEMSQYKLLEPCLRLASAILESPASLRFLHDLIWAPRQRLPDVFRGLPLEVFRDTRCPSSVIKTRMALVWDKIARNNCFGVSSVNEHKAQGWTRYWIAEGIDAGTDLREDNLPGLKTKVLLSTKLVENLFALMKSNGANELEVLVHTFLVAQVLCHEIAHAVDFALDRDLFKRVKASGSTAEEKNEPFYQDQRCVELGIAWEQQVFGGKPRIPDSWVDVHCSLHEWATFGPIETGTRICPRRGPTRFTINWILDLRCLVLMQQQWFWEANSKADGDAADKLLHFPKDIGRLFECRDSLEDVHEARRKIAGVASGDGIVRAQWLEGTLDNDSTDTTVTEQSLRERYQAAYPNTADRRTPLTIATARWLRIEELQSEKHGDTRDEWHEVKRRKPADFW